MSPFYDPDLDPEHDSNPADDPYYDDYNCVYYNYTWDPYYIWYFSMSWTYSFGQGGAVSGSIGKTGRGGSSTTISIPSTSSSVGFNTGTSSGISGVSTTN